MEAVMTITTSAVVSVVMLTMLTVAIPTASADTLAVVMAHADDESPIGPALARYARAGVHVYLIVATDGARGFGQSQKSDRQPANGTDLARVRADEARCAAGALGAQPPILLGFPDAKLGDYAEDKGLLYRLTDRLMTALERVQPDAIVTWGPDGGYGHPDHRVISSITTQLVRAGAPGATEQLFYMNIPVEAMRAIYPGRGEPPWLVPRPKYFTVRVTFEPQDADVARRAMACHRSQFTDEMVERATAAGIRAWADGIRLIPAESAAKGDSVFAK
jgi:LmbE family N-acetylglucosaminyl deacetylase